MNIGELMTYLFSHYRRKGTPNGATRHSLDGLERVTVPPVEGSAYEFMMENLGDPPTERFDRWRHRMPQG